jgi:DNA invertase Pin-like site-specific DNA recombinase
MRQIGLEYLAALLLEIAEEELAGKRGCAMHSELNGKNAVAAIRVSTTKQGTDGDSPEAQKEQIERFAANKGVTIKKYFVFMESASKDQQPMQEAVDYCTRGEKRVDLFIIKSIDRFTRGGSSKL